MVCELENRAELFENFTREVIGSLAGEVSVWEEVLYRFLEGYDVVFEIRQGRYSAKMHGDRITIPIISSFYGYKQITDILSVFRGPLEDVPLMLGNTCHPVKEMAHFRMSNGL